MNAIEAIGTRRGWAVIDAETNGLPDYKLPADDPRQPRLANLGIVLLSPTLETVEEREILVVPDGWAMTPGAAAVNGLTDEELRENGIPIMDALSLYAGLIHSGYAVAAYGAQHDCKILRGELRRAGLPDLFEETPNVCLMRACHPLKVKKANGKGGWPRLDDALRHFGLEPEATPHRALNGARAAAGVLRKLAEVGALPAPSVHFAAEGKP